MVQNADLIIEGSLYGNGMYVVPDGKVIFRNVSCDEKDIVQGIFVTDQTFESTYIRNTDLKSYERCEDGRLEVQ